MSTSESLQTPPDALLDERGFSKLVWRCRRGLLENDLFIERFFKRFDGQVSVRQAQGLTTLMDLSDNDLLDLLLRRQEASGDWVTPEVELVLTQLRTQ